MHKHKHKHKHAMENSTPSTDIQNNQTNLHISIYNKFCDAFPSLSTVHEDILAKTEWYRVKYKSKRYDNECVTPCWTTFYGGISNADKSQAYMPIPSFLQPLVLQVSTTLKTPFNAILVRLYFDGKDNIAWHTDGRKFLGKTPTIASLSFGGTGTFEMRRMRNVWPCVTGGGGEVDDGIDRETETIKFDCKDGDMLVMSGDTQDHWHHRVPKEKGRMPRVNINFRYIVPTPNDTTDLAGQATYYKYMVYGDSKEEFLNSTLETFKYADLLKANMSILSFSEKSSETKKSSTFTSTTTLKRKPKEKSQISSFFGPPKKLAKNLPLDIDSSSLSSGWICKACTFENFNTCELVCEVCEIRK